MLSRSIAFLFAVLTLFGRPPAAAAEGVQLELRAGFGAGAMVSRAQRDLGYGVAMVPELRPALRFAALGSVELVYAGWMFPSDAGTGRATQLGAGLRFDPRLTSSLSVFLDGHAGVGLSGPRERFMFDAGAGLEYALSPSIAFGPFVRYGQMADELGDPRFVAGGVLVALAWPEDEPPPPPRARVAPPPPPPQPRPAPPTVAVAAPPPPRLTDSDNDGLRDEDDRCPTEPRGPTPDPQRPGCPDGDDDKDGVANGVDRCREQHLGFYADPAAMGCPLGDRDKDAVPDLYDACPDKAGAPGVESKKNGCPGLVQVEAGMIKILKPVLFAANREVILSSSFKALSAVADALRATPGIKKLSIEAHTDGQGVPEQNQELSQRRADSIKRWLTDNGIETDRLEAKGFGDSRPIATNKTSKGRAENRRVELVIVDPAPEARLTP